MNTVKHTNSISQIIGPWPDVDSPCLLTQTGELCVFLEDYGRDPDGMGSDDIFFTTAVARTGLTQLPGGTREQTYLWNHRAIIPQPVPRTLSVCNAIEQSRYDFLNSCDIFTSRKLRVLTLQTNSIAGRMGFAEFITSLLQAPFNLNVRANVLSMFSFDASKTFLIAELDKAKRQLLDAADIYIQRWSGHSKMRLLGPADAYKWFKALHELDHRFLNESLELPSSPWCHSPINGSIQALQINGVEHIKCSAARSIYARVGSITRFGESVPLGAWLQHPSPLNHHGEYLITSNSHPLDAFSTSAKFRSANAAVERSHFNLSRAVAKSTSDFTIDQTDYDPSKMHRETALKALHDAEQLSERWFHSNHSVFLIDESPQNIRESAIAFDSTLSNHDMSLVWESAVPLDVYASMLPGSRPFGPRALMHNSAQVAAAVTHYRRDPGQFSIVDINESEPQIVLETIDGGIYGFSPFCGEKSTLIGVGPTGGGKSFAKNVFNAHFAKWGGFIADIGFDDGSVNLAKLFGDDAAIMRGAVGMNPFTAKGEGQGAPFEAHFTNLLMSMLESNDDPSMRTLAPGEQEFIDQALRDTLALSKTPRLSTFAAHLPLTTKMKFARWLTDCNGRYAHLLDSEIDQFGELDKSISVFNLFHLLEDRAALRPVLLEIIQRLSLAYMDPSRRHLPKKLILDECHFFLSNPIGASLVVKLARTIRKFMMALELWSQGCSEYESIPDWKRLKEAASYFIFTANPQAEEDEHRRVFGLTSADVSTIRSLVPKRDLYLVQPETGVRKHIVLRTDKFTHAWASSTARVVHRRDQLLEALPFFDAVQVVAKEVL